MASVVLSPPALRAYTDLEKAGADDMLDAIDAALDILEDNPGDTRARKRAFTSGVFGMTIRDRTDNWVLLWELDDHNSDIVRVRYLGPDPFAA